MMITRFNPYLMLLTGMIICSCQVDNPSNADALPADPSVGDWQGIITYSDQTVDTIAVQVIGYGEGKYRADVRHRFDVRDPHLAVMEGESKENLIRLSGDQEGIKWTGTISAEDFSGSIIGNRAGSFSLEKVIRSSPSLGQLPPADAVVLFSGQSLENWEHQRDATGYINLVRVIGGNDCAAYLTTRIFADSEREAIIEAGSDDGIKIWWNGDQVLAKNEKRGAEPGQNMAQIRLTPGWNKILVKVNNGDGGWGVFLRITDMDGTPVEELQIEDPLNPGKFDPAFPIKTDYFISHLKYAGPFRVEGKSGEELFDHPFGPELSESDISWQIIDPDSVDYRPKWDLEENVLRVKPGSGNLVSRQKFKDVFMHVEFRSPYMPGATGQKRGNSGVYIQGRYEIQVLDSYGLKGEDDECGGIYKVSRPRVNMCAPPLQWQTYDIEFIAPRFSSEGAKISHARITVRHNGVFIHENLELTGVTGGALDNRTDEPGGLMLQDHGDPVEFRNIWVIPR